MRPIVIFLVLFFVFLSLKFFKPAVVVNEPPSFDLVKTLRVEPPHAERFDISGIVAVGPLLKNSFRLKGDFLVVNDQDAMIYEGRIDGDLMRVSPWFDIANQSKAAARHLTDIDTNGRSLFALDETGGDFYEITQPTLAKSLPLVKKFEWETPNSETHFGAIGAGDQNILVGSEDSTDGVFDIQVSLPESPSRKYRREGSGSQTSIRVRGSLVYILDSFNRCVWEEKLVNDDKPLKLSFRTFVDSAPLKYGVYDQQLNPRPEWGTASALEISGDTFYIGLDNNAQGLLANPKETRSSIMVLKRKH